MEYAIKSRAPCSSRLSPPLDPDLQQASPKVIVSIDVTDVGDGFYNGGCVDPTNGIGYMILGASPSPSRMRSAPAAHTAQATARKRAHMSSSP